MITCAQLEDLVADYLEGSLSQPKRPELDGHVMECRGCREFLAAYRRTVWVAKKSLQISGSPVQAPERLVEAILGSLQR
jgi:putative zinc finger protein